MNKEFSHKAVLQACRDFPEADQYFITFGNVLDISRDVAAGAVYLNEIHQRIQRCIDINRAYRAVRRQGEFLKANREANPLPEGVVLVGHS